MGITVDLTMLPLLIELAVVCLLIWFLMWAFKHVPKDKKPNEFGEALFALALFALVLGVAALMVIRIAAWIL
jgi:hypothetical protein